MRRYLVFLSFPPSKTVSYISELSIIHSNFYKDCLSNGFHFTFKDPSLGVVEHECSIARFSALLQGGVQGQTVQVHDVMEKWRVFRTLKI